jgi:hypothetical protein
MPAFGMVEEEPPAVVAFALSYFPTVVPRNQQFDGGQSEGAAHVLKFVKRQDQANPLLVCESRPLDRPSRAAVSTTCSAVDGWTSSRRLDIETTTGRPPEPERR